MQQNKLQGGPMATEAEQQGAPQEKYRGIISSIIAIVKDKGYTKVSTYEGACFCAEFTWYDVHVRTHCQRVCDSCKVDGIHIWLFDGSLAVMEFMEPLKPLLQELGEEIRRQLDEIWGEGETEIRFEPYRT